jgi:hypothetical protein
MTQSGHRLSSVLPFQSARFALYDAVKMGFGKAMMRRELIRLFGLAATWPLAARAQGKMPVVGYMSGRAPEESEHLTAAFRDGLSETGFVEGRGWLGPRSDSGNIDYSRRLWRRWRSC